MNKIKNLLKGSPLAMVVASLVIAGVASAAIVSYISNAPTATVTVSSPVDMGIYEGVYDTGKTGHASIGIETDGGSSMPYTTIVTNNANNRIGGYYVTVIEATDGGDLMTGEEITKVSIDKNEPGFVDRDITAGLCVVKENGGLMKLSDYIAGNNSDKRLILFFDFAGLSTEQLCSPLTETRSVSHLEAGETEKWTATLTWNAAASGTFKIFPQYVNPDDLAGYAAEQYYGL